MRSAPTDAERAVWKIVRNGQLEGYRFRRQYVMQPYILDFVCLERRLIVEVDGAHHAEQAAYDAARDEFFRIQGYRVLRFSDREALLEIEGVATAIVQVLSSPPPQPSPMKGVTTHLTHSTPSDTFLFRREEPLMVKHPETLVQAIRYFSDDTICRDYVAAIRWPNGVACPTCGSVEIGFIASRGMWQCKEKHPRKQFSVKVGTIFEDSPVSLDKWLAAMWMLVNAKNGISSYEVGKSIGVTQATAWFMLQRLRLALEDGTFNKMKGEVEADETYIGGKARNMNKARKAKTFGTQKPNGMMGKAGVMGFIEREGPNGHSVVRTMRIEDNRRDTIEGAVREQVEPGTALYTDGLGSYRFLAGEYVHGVVEHDAKEYVRGEVHTNRIENFWALLKRSLGGTYVSVEPFHLFRYLDEQVFRFNTRELTDAKRFHAAMKGIIGKRLTYAQLTAEGSQSPA